MRKIKSLLNIIGTTCSYVITVIFQFITQACIVKILGIEYSGINGLFTNIITMLSIAELGIGTTIIFKLYEPLAKNNTEKVKSWMKFYKTCYNIVAILVMCFGLLIIPLVPSIVGEVSIDQNIILLYFISLLDTVLSYVMTYKRSLLYADQKNYIINFVHMGYTIFLNLTQILILYITKSYILFLVIKLIYRFLENVVINLFVNKYYPYILEKSVEISKADKRDVIKRISSIFLQKVSFVINKGVDNILISLYFNVQMVGYYTNYNIIVLALCQIIYQVVSSFTASIGNLLTEKDKEKNYSIYKKINMLNSFFTGVIISGFICVISPFISVWVGEQYILPWYVVLAFSIYIYSDSIRRSITIFKDAAGICKEDKYMYIIMAILNLVASIFLCKIIGISGVILGTAISYLFLIIYSYPKFIFKPIFNKKYRFYFYDMFKYLVYIVLNSIVSISIVNTISINNYIFSILINGIISVCISCICFILLFIKTDELHYYINTIKKVLKKIIIKLNINV